MAHPFPGMWLKSPAINAHSQPRGARAAATTQEKKADFPPALLIIEVLLRFFNLFFIFFPGSSITILYVTIKKRGGRRCRFDTSMVYMNMLIHKKYM